MAGAYLCSLQFSFKKNKVNCILMVEYLRDIYICLIFILLCICLYVYTFNIAPHTDVLQ